MSVSIATVMAREQRLMHVLDRMETRGTRVDIPRIQEIKKFYEEIRNKARKEIDKIAGKDFNPASPKQMQKLFFGKLKCIPLEYSRKKKSKTFVDCIHCKGFGCTICQETGKNPKCDGDFLEHVGIKELADDKIEILNPLAYNILFHNAADVMIRSAHAFHDMAVWESPGVAVAHPAYRQAKVRTGRLSCSHFQAIAADDSKGKHVDIPYRTREIFIPRDGFTFYIPDYSQIEVWILALVAGAKNLVKMLASGGDAHQIVGDMIFPNSYNKDRVKKFKAMPMETLKPAEKAELNKANSLRKETKEINFGIIYGEGNEKIASKLKKTPGWVADFKTKYFGVFPEIGEYMQSTIKSARQLGYVLSPYGRRYYVERGLEYRGTNYSIQGPAADLIKSGMMRADDASRTMPIYKGKLFLQMQYHDELLFEVHKSIDNMQTMKDVCQWMNADKNFLGSPVPFSIGMKVAPNRWSEAKEIKL